MTVFALDLETFPIRPGRQAPRPVAAGLTDAGSTRVALWRDAAPYLRRCLERGDLWINHRTAFDAACAVDADPDLFPVVLRAYREDRIEDTQIRESLIRLAQGTFKKYQKAALVELLARHKLPIPYKVDEQGRKAEVWRTRFWELDGIEPEDWPEDARSYLLADADCPLRVREAQDRYPAAWLVDQHRQARADFVLYLTGAWGVRVDQRERRELESFLEAEIEHHAAILRAQGIVRANGTRNEKYARERVAARAAQLEIDLERAGGYTDSGQVSLNKDFLAGVAEPVDPQRPEAGDVWASYVAYSSASKTRNRLQRLTRAGDCPVQVSYDVLKETGRTSAKSGDRSIGEEVSAWGDAIQNLDRKPGLRECYAARLGCLLWSCDFTAGELHTLAQVCIWLGLRSRLAAVLNSGRDVHLLFAAESNGWTYEWAAEAAKGLHGPEAEKKVKEARQGAKAADFGFPGGLGWEKFMLYAWKVWRVRMDKAQAQRLKRDWLAMFPEMWDYFRIVDELVKSKEPQRFFWSQRLRGGTYFANAANGWFQGLLADIAKEAGFRLIEARLRPVIFAHDEWIGESPIELASAHAQSASAIMEQVGREVCPDVPLRAPPALCRRWRKGAEPVWAAPGVLIPWEDRTLKPAEIAKVIELHGKRGGNVHRVGWETGLEPERVVEIVRQAA